jgi:putative endonuclease
MPDPRHRLGIAAEAAVAMHLESLGWRILERRWRCRFGELDLVCLGPGCVLVGVEVRARRTKRAGSPLESIDARRLHRLRASLVEYTTSHRGRYDGLRIDLAAVDRPDGAWRIGIHFGVDAW